MQCGLRGMDLPILGGWPRWLVCRSAVFILLYSLPGVLL